MQHIINRKNLKYYLISSVFLIASVLFWSVRFFPVRGAETPTELILLWNADFSSDEVSSRLSEAFPELTLLEHDTDFSVCSIDATASYSSLLRRLNNHPDIRLAEPDYAMELMEFTPPDDPYNDALWGFENSGSYERYYGSFSIPQTGTPDVDMNIWEAWKHYPLPMEKTQPVIVAIIDTGIDYKHPAQWVQRPCG